jgi:3-methyladenine DNA glycosylase/8-oxoguanine DNA glycosylase
MWHLSPMTDALEMPLKGPKGEPVDFLRTIASHGVAELPPNELSLEERTLRTTLLMGGSARTVRLTSADRKLRLDVVAGRVGARAREALTATVSHMFRLDEDLSAFYELVSDDPGLDWCALGAGRMLRAPTVFEDVVKTICTLVRTAVSGSGLARRAPSPS